MIVGIVLKHDADRNYVSTKTAYRALLLNEILLRNVHD